MAAVRPEFRVDILFPAADDPVLGWEFCAVPGCDRPAGDYELCKGHGSRWLKLARSARPGQLHRQPRAAAAGPQ
ncbi:hypothetical protein [Nonomuraea sp. NPDC049607]|uniref:hypothetical protein n=1 Tax=Nonomuraea sp. NPDC049607 TaxID=3154732 RepID=UPI0034230C73